MRRRTARSAATIADSALERRVRAERPGRLPARRRQAVAHRTARLLLSTKRNSSSTRLRRRACRSTTEIVPYRERERTSEAGVTWQRAGRRLGHESHRLATREQDRWRRHATTLDRRRRCRKSRSRQACTGQWRDHRCAARSRAPYPPAASNSAPKPRSTRSTRAGLTIDAGRGPRARACCRTPISAWRKRAAKAFVSHAWRINERWSLDSRLAAETSRLSFTGDTEQSVSLTYVKPRVQLTRKFGQHQLQMRVFRDVGQLDFDDFVSTAQLARRHHRGRQSGSAAADRRGPRRSRRICASRTTPRCACALFKHFVDDVVDFVPVGPPGKQIRRARQHRRGQHHRRRARRCACR